MDYGAVEALFHEGLHEKLSAGGGVFEAEADG